MSIEIKTEKVVNGNGAKERKILGWKTLPSNELPEIYFEQFPRVFDNSYGLLIIEHEKYEWRIAKGNTITEDEFQRLLVVFGEAERRLKEVNKHLAELRAEWNGEETFII